MSNFQSLIIISDGVPSKQAGGISQTLYNLLDGYTTTPLYFVKGEEAVDDKKHLLNGEIITVKFNPIQIPANRLGLWLHKLLVSINAALIDFFFKVPEYFNTIPQPAILVSTTNFNKLQYALQLSKALQCKLITYFMDDWMATQKTSWIINNAQRVIQQSIKNSVGVIHISKTLQQTVERRYKISTPQSIVLHNPVNKRGEVKVKMQQPFVIAYAGSIWPMHWDALLITAKAVKHLQQKGLLIQLQIFCKAHFWEQYKKYLQVEDVLYKGFVEYDNLPQALEHTDIGLVTASYEKAYAAFSKSSVQTKLTDYMSIGKPILSVGPSYAIGHQFVQEHDCGFVIDTEEISEVAKQIEAIVENESTWYAKSINALNAIEHHFEKRIVQEKLYQFLEQV